MAWSFLKLSRKEAAMDADAFSDPPSPPQEDGTTVPDPRASSVNPLQAPRASIRAYPRRNVPSVRKRLEQRRKQRGHH